MRYRDVVSVTVVIPCFRCANTIKRAIDSVVQQTQKPAEIILVDDASGDDTMIALRSIEKQYPGWVKIIGLDENSGAGSARNVGWSAATQPYVAFLDSDDAWHPQKIEIQYNYMRQHPEAVLCGHARRILREKNELPHWVVSSQVEAEQISKWSMLLSNKFVTPSVMLRSDIKQRFVERQRHMEDHLLWLEIVCDGGIVVKLPVELAAIYKSPFGESGLSSQIWLMGKGDLSNYLRLYQMGCLNFGQGLFFGLYSLIKFIRRLFIYWGYLQWKK